MSFSDIEFKASSGTFNVDQAQGIVECFVAGVGNKDSVGDVLLPGAFNGSLKRRKPRVVWGHNWNDPIGKVLEIYEVPPSDPRLPLKMKAAGIGGLYARVQFNLQSEKGREAFANVAFFGEEQEWSIGYKTIQASFDPNLQANILKEVELYEVSPVLHGANQLTGTISVKSDTALAEEEKGHGMMGMPGMPQSPGMPSGMGRPMPPKPQQAVRPVRPSVPENPLMVALRRELVKRSGSNVLVRSATDNIVIFDRLTSDGESSTYRVAYNFQDGQFMFGKPERVQSQTVYMPETPAAQPSGTPAMAFGVSVKPQADAYVGDDPSEFMVMPGKTDDFDFEDFMLDELEEKIGRSLNKRNLSKLKNVMEMIQDIIASAEKEVEVKSDEYVIPVDIKDAFHTKQLLDPIMDYHRVDSYVSEKGIVITSGLSPEFIDAVETLKKGLGNRIGRAIGGGRGGKGRRLARGISARFDPNAWDGDGDGLVQEGTPFQRPAIPGVNDRSTGGKVNLRRAIDAADAAGIPTGKDESKKRGLRSSTDKNKMEDEILRRRENGESLAEVAESLGMRREDVRQSELRAMRRRDGGLRSSTDKNKMEDEILRRRENGESLAEVAESLGMRREDVRQSELRAMRRRDGGLRSKTDDDNVDKLLNDMQVDIDRDKAIVDARLAGKSLEEVANTYGSTREEVRQLEIAQIKQRAKRLIPTRGETQGTGQPRFQDTDRALADFIMRKRMEGEPLRDVASFLGVTPEDLRQWEIQEFNWRKNNGGLRSKTVSVPSRYRDRVISFTKEIGDDIENYPTAIGAPKVLDRAWAKQVAEDMRSGSAKVEDLVHMLNLAMDDMNMERSKPSPNQARLDNSLQIAKNMRRAIVDGMSRDELDALSPDPSRQRARIPETPDDNLDAIERIANGIRSATRGSGMIKRDEQGRIDPTQAREMRKKLEEGIVTRLRDLGFSEDEINTLTNGLNRANTPGGMRSSTKMDAVKRVVDGAKREYIDSDSLLRTDGEKKIASKILDILELGDTENDLGSVLAGIRATIRESIIDGDLVANKRSLDDSIDGLINMAEDVLGQLVGKDNTDANELISEWAEQIYSSSKKLMPEIKNLSTPDKRRIQRSEDAASGLTNFGMFKGYSGARFRNEFESVDDFAEQLDQALTDYVDGVDIGTRDTAADIASAKQSISDAVANIRLGQSGIEPTNDNMERVMDEADAIIERLDSEIGAMRSPRDRDVQRVRGLMSRTGNKTSISLDDDEITALRDEIPMLKRNASNSRALDALDKKLRNAKDGKIELTKDEMLDIEDAIESAKANSRGSGPGIVTSEIQSLLDQVADTDSYTSPNRGMRSSSGSYERGMVARPVSMTLSDDEIAELRDEIPMLKRSASSSSGLDALDEKLKNAKNGKVELTPEEVKQVEDAIESAKENSGRSGKPIVTSDIQGVLDQAIEAEGNSYVSLNWEDQQAGKRGNLGLRSRSNNGAPEFINEERQKKLLFFMNSSRGGSLGVSRRIREDYNKRGDGTLPAKDWKALNTLYTNITGDAIPDTKPIKGVRSSTGDGDTAAPSPSRRMTRSAADATTGKRGVGRPMGTYKNPDTVGKTFNEVKPDDWDSMTAEQQFNWLADHSPERSGMRKVDYNRVMNEVLKREEGEERAAERAQRRREAGPVQPMPRQEAPKPKRDVEVKPRPENAEDARSQRKDDAEKLNSVVDRIINDASSLSDRGRIDSMHSEAWDEIADILDSDDLTRNQIKAAIQRLQNYLADAEEADETDGPAERIIQRAESLLKAMKTLDKYYKGDNFIDDGPEIEVSPRAGRRGAGIADISDEAFDDVGGMATRLSNAPTDIAEEPIESGVPQASEVITRVADGGLRSRVPANANKYVSQEVRDYVAARGKNNGLRSRTGEKQGRTEVKAEATFFKDILDSLPKEISAADKAKDAKTSAALKSLQELINRQEAAKLGSRRTNAGRILMTRDEVDNILDAIMAVIDRQGSIGGTERQQKFATMLDMLAKAAMATFIDRTVEELGGRTVKRRNSRGQNVDIQDL